MLSQAVPPSGPDLRTASPACRFCGRPLDRIVVDLGMSPLCEAFLRPDQLDEMEPFYPLRVFVCDSCFLVQLVDYVAPKQIFSEYAYFSSYSDSWLAHAGRFARSMVERLGLDETSLVVELGSNDGYLLRNFLPAGVPVLGIEPAANVAAAAQGAGIDTIVRFFGAEMGRELADSGRRADLLVANNVLAQAPALNDFVAGAKLILKPEGLLTIEFPHLLRLLEENQFDTIYHEHFSYFSLLSARRILSAHGLDVVDVEELPTHGGSLRLYVRHAEFGASPAPAVGAVEERERLARLDSPAGYAGVTPRVEEVKRDMLAFLIEARRAGRSVVGYGAPGKANTFLNYCGIRTDLVSYTVDRNPYKHGRFTPGTHIPIHPPGRIRETRPDFVWILPWNLRSEIAEQIADVGAWGCRLVVAIPRFEILR
jgi:C-methyltransferase C-terminal domain/Putative zinc binding domain/Methyltransferase domain